MTGSFRASPQPNIRPVNGVSCPEMGERSVITDVRDAFGRELGRRAAGGTVRVPSQIFEMVDM
jgi:hypothetical protein